MRRLLLLVILSVGLMSSIYADSKYPLTIGLGGGCTDFYSLGGEVYLKYDFHGIFNRRSEIKIGLNNHTYSLDLNHVSSIEVVSLGLFSDITVFPFEKGLFTGVRWQMFNTTSLPETTKIKFKESSSYEGKTLSAGYGFYIQAGYHLPLSDKFGIRLLGQPGWQNFKVSRIFPSQSLPVENHYRFMFDLVLSLEMKL